MSLKVNSFSAFLVRTFGKLATSRTRSFVFVATTGRSGTHTLHRLFGSGEGIVAFHEPHPIMHAEVMIGFNEGIDDVARREFKLRKAPRIYLSAAFKSAYFEANHMFIKSFAEFALQEFGSKLRLIHLKRDPLQVAVSLLHRGSIPGTDQGNTWMLDYKAKRNIIDLSRELSSQEFSHDLYKCLWYCEEIDARTQKFVEENPSCNARFMETDQLNSYGDVLQLLNWADVKVDQNKLRELVGSKSNTSGISLSLPDDVDETALQKFSGLCAEYKVKNGIATDAVAR